ncbi:MAG: membrane protein insertion efficiency factor YidD [Dehalococcoidia bacterium]|nr:membrane protein insertion efficiency factor YidD [Dehalococcoidia bacterium]
MKQPVLGLIRLYKRTLSPYWPASCRYTPTCSDYAHEAVLRFGAMNGGWLVLRRLARCRPLGGSGYDPVPNLEHPSHPGAHVSGSIETESRAMGENRSAG